MSKLEAARLSWAKKIEPSQGTIALTKVEKILEGSLDSITSPSVKTQVMEGGKFARGAETKHCWMLSSFENVKFADKAKQCFAFKSFPPIF